MTTEEKFHAAVNVIRSLPKNGSYQPSYDLMLRFYAYFKQGTLGPCIGKRPAFYQVVEKAKYDAWKALGDMTQAQAMAKYVDELHTIVETMSYSDKVANFLEAPSDEVECVNMIMNDLEIVAGDVLDKIRSRPNSPLASREASPTRQNGSISPVSSLSIDADVSDHSDDEYIDTIEYPDPVRRTYNEQNGYTTVDHVSRYRTNSKSIDVSLEISKAVQSLKNDIERLTSKINSLERNSALLSRQNTLFSGVSFQLIAFIVAWPFLATLLVNRLLNKHKK